MQPKPLQQDQGHLFTSRLSQQLNPEHELLRLARVIPWQELEEEFNPLFSEGPSRPPLPVRLATGLMILQHMYGKSDENVVAAWVENPYWQAFCGYDFLQWELPVHLKLADKVVPAHQSPRHREDPASFHSSCPRDADRKTS